MSWIDDAKSEAARYHIKPCSKCGGRAVPCGDRTCGFETYWVRCTECGNESKWHVEIGYAIREWNRTEKWA